MNICPIKDENWKAFEKLHGGSYHKAMKAWIENGYEIPNVRNYDMKNMSVVTDELNKLEGVSVLIDTSIDGVTEVNTQGDEKVISINPIKIKDDSIVNEFGHIFIEILGASSKALNKVGAKNLRSSSVMKAIEATSKDLTEDEKNQAALSIAIGKDSNEIFSTRSEGEKFEFWKRGFFNRLKRVTNISPEDAFRLASQPVNMYKSEKADPVEIEKELYRQNESKLYKNLSKKEKQAKDALNIIETKIIQQESKLDSKSKTQKAALGKLKRLRKQFNRLEAESALYGFVKTAESQVTTVETKFKSYIKGESKPSLEGVKYLRDAMLAFDTDLLKEIRDDLKEDQQEAKDSINKAIVKQDNIHSMYKTLAAKLLVEEIKVPVEVIQKRYERRAELEFNLVERELKGKERQDKLEEYTRDYLEKNSDNIEKDKQNYLDNFLTIITRDISAFDALIGNPKDINNDVVQTVARMFEEMDFNTRQESIEMVKNTEDLYQKFIKFYGKKNTQEEQWDLFLLYPEDQVGASLAAVTSKKGREIKEGKYKGTPVEKLYDHLLNLASERDSKLPKSKQLGLRLPIMHKNFYERVGEDGIIKAIKEGTVDQFKVRKDETDFGSLDDSPSAARYSLDKGVKINDTATEKRKIIPIHYRNKNIEASDRSVDVLTLMVLDSYQAIDYDNKRKIANRVEGVLDLVKEATTYKRTGLLGRLETKGDNNAPVTKEGIPNIAGAIESMIENRLYGIKTSGDAQGAKIANKVRQYSSFINLFGNYISGGANLTQGTAMVFMEGVGSKFYGIDNVKNGSKKYRKDLPRIIQDNTSRVFKSKTNLLNEMFDASSEYQALKSEFSKDSALKREGNLGVGFAFNSSAEHIAQNIGMYSLLDNIKVKNEKGEYFNSKGEVVKDRKDAMSIDEAYSVGFQNKETKKTISAEQFSKLKDSQKGAYTPNVLHLDSRVASTDRSEKGVNNFAVSQTLKRINRDLFGNYDKENRSRLERHAIGGLLLHMRGWMETGVRKRWKGVSTTYKKVDGEESWKRFKTIKNIELKDEDLIYNVETSEFEEGMYVSTLRFASNTLEDIKALKLKALSENWKDLSTLEKNNIKKSVVEGVVLPTLAYIVFAALSASLDGDDEEDRVFTELAALYAIRLNKELVTYYDPTEWLRTLRSPAVTLTLLETTKDAISQLVLNPLEEVSSGENKGENKFLNKLIKLLPGKALLRDPGNTLRFYK